MAESGRENADNGVGIIVELNLSPENSRLSAKPAGPQTVADYCRFRETRRFVARTEHPPDVCGNTEHGKIVRTHLQQFETFRTLSAGQACRATLDTTPWLKTPALDLRSSNSRTESPMSRTPTPRLLATIFTRRSGWEKGSPRNKTALTMLKIAVFAPTPKARESTATIVKPGFFQSTRSPNRMSCNNVVIKTPRCQSLSDFDHGGTTPLVRA